MVFKPRTQNLLPVEQVLGPMNPTTVFTSIGLYRPGTA